MLRADTDRFAEKVMGNILKLVNAVGLFKKFRPLATTILAKKLAVATKLLPN